MLEMPRWFNDRAAQRISRLVVSLLVLCLPLACGTEQATGNPEQNESTASADATSAAAGSAEEKPYDVDCSQVDEDGDRFCVTDKATYVGWRTFHAACHACHGQNAVGSSFAPSLKKDISKERFVDVVKNGYTGQIGVMPAWGENPNVKNFIDELYAYQQAVADGVLLPGRPKRKD